MDFKNALKYLQQKASYENVSKLYYKSENFNLDRIDFALENLGINHKNLRFIHVAGSKGKGTVARLLANYLQAKGFRVGIFTSPHLFDVRERVVIDRKKISKKDFSGLINLISKFIGLYNVSLTYFEILTVLAIKHFVEKKVDFAILEVGVGGRLDATNVVFPDVSVLTKIEREHLKLLGGSLSKIVDEKLGIAKKNVPLAVGLQSKKVNTLIKQKLANTFTELDSFFVENFERDLGVNFEKFNVVSGALIENAKLVCLVLRILFQHVDQGILLKILGSLKIPCHFQIKRLNGKTVVFDVAHTLSSVKNLVDDIAVVFPKKKPVFLVALMRDKDIKGILKLISNIAGRITLTHAHEIRGELPEKMRKFLESGGYRKVSIMKDPVLAYRKALGKLKENEILVVAGSHFLIEKVAKIEN